MAGWSSGESFDEIYGHCYLTVISWLWYQQSKYIMCFKFVAFRGSITTGPAIFYSVTGIMGGENSGKSTR